MKVAIDCRMYQSSGIGSYIQGVLPHLIEDCGKNEFILIGLDKHIKHFCKKNVSLLPISIPIFSMRETFLFPLKKINSCDIFLSFNYNIPCGIRIPIYSFIHDILFLDLPNVTSKIGSLIRHLYLLRSFYISEGIFTVSQFSKERIYAKLGGRKHITVAYGAIKPSLVRAKKVGFKKTLSNTNYILFVGNLKPHKGLQTLIQAWLEALKSGYKNQLYIVGTGAGMKTIDTNTQDINNEYLHFLGTVSDHKLFELMQNAELLVQPSAYEGFGLPPLEALYLGTTCILSDIPVFKEIYQDIKNCHFFTQGDPKALTRLLLGISPQKIEQCDSLLEKFNFDITSKLILNTIGL